MALLQLLISEGSLCKDVQGTVSVCKKKQPACRVHIRGLASAATGAVRRLSHHTAEQPAGTWSREQAQRGRPEISVSSLGSWRGQRPPHEEPSPCRGGPRLLGLWGLKVFAGQQRVNPTLFHFLPGGVAVTPPGLVTRHCESMNSRDEKPSERGAGMGTTQLSSLGLPTRSRSLSSPTNWGDGRPSRRKGLEQVAGLHLAGAAATIVFNWGGRESN